MVAAFFIGVLVGAVGYAVASVAISKLKDLITKA